jgi:hypothetical protein
MAKKTRAYVLISGRHVHYDGKTYYKGDNIELNPRMARFLVNKVKAQEVAEPAPTGEQGTLNTPADREELIAALELAGVDFDLSASDEDLFAAWQLITE